MENYILNYYRILLNYQERIQELTIQSEELLETTMVERLRFYFQSNLKKALQRELTEQRLGQINGDIKRYEEGCSTIEKWFKSKTAITEAMFIELLKFLLSEYEHSEVMVRKGNTINELTPEEILSYVRRNTNFSEYSYTYYQFLLVDAKQAYQLDMKDKYVPLFHVFDMETGTIQEAVTMGHPKLAQGIMEFLNYRIAHPEIDTEMILEAFQAYYKKELKEFTKVKS